MARTNKVGVDYFPLDVDFFLDDKMQLIEAEFGVKGGYVAIRLLCKIYKEGYFYKWGADECLLFAKSMGVDGVSKNILDEIVKGLIKRGFFNESVFNSFRVLTSSGIQRRYFEITKRYKSVTAIKEILLTNVSEYDNVDIIDINEYNNRDNANNNPQKKIKGKENKEKEIIARFDIFWNEYHSITGLPKSDRDAALRYWKRLTEKERDRASASVHDYFNSLPDPKYCKKCRTYLGDKNFNDEFKAGRKPSSSGLVQ